MSRFFLPTASKLLKTGKFQSRRQKQPVLRRCGALKPRLAVIGRWICALRRFPPIRDPIRQFAILSNCNYHEAGTLGRWVSKTKAVSGPVLPCVASSWLFNSIQLNLEIFIPREQ